MGDESDYLDDGEDWIEVYGSEEDDEEGGSMSTVNCCYNCANSFKVAYGTVLCCTEHKCQVEPCNYCEKWRCIGAIWQ